MHRTRPTVPVGLYDPSYEHDACGVAMVARLDGVPSHETVQRAVVALENLEHRGAAGADPNTGDGAGILLQLPDELLRGVIGEELPAAGRYGVAVCFLPQDDERRAELEALLTSTVEAEGQRVVGWRDVPVDKDYVGITANYFAPYIKQLVVAAGTPECEADQDAFERKLYVIRRVAELAAGPDLVVPSFSSRTIVYKGMLTAPQLLGYYPDLQDTRTKTALGLVHSRFSTNTFPSWELAHPYRYIAHNGEINTLRGNVNWMRARESQLASELFGEEDLAKLLPIVRPGGSDSATFDNVLELLVLAGRSLPHAVMMMVPEAFEGRDDLPDAPHGLLRLPLLSDGAVGRPRRGRVHRRPRDRRDARPQRPAPRPLAGDQGRLGRARLRDRRDGRAGLQHRPQGPPAARQALPRRPRGGPDRRRRGGQARGRHPAALRRLVPRGRRPPRRPARRRSRPCRAPSRCACASWRSATRRRTCACCSARPRRAPPSRSARWATTSRWPCSPTASRRCSPTSSSSSRRSRTRRSTRSASRS